MKKVAFSGIPRSGKTSVLSEVRKILGLKYRVEEVEDIGWKNPFDVDQKGGFSSQFFYITTQVNEENRKAAENPDWLLCDRSVLDQWVHWRKIMQGREEQEKWRDRHEIMRALFRFWMPTYDLIVHIRFDLAEIAHRKNEEDRFGIAEGDRLAHIEELFLDTIAREQVPVVEVWNNLSIDECAHRVIQEITDRKLI